MKFDISLLILEAKRIEKDSKEREKQKGPKIPLTVRPQLFPYDPIKRDDNEFPPSYQIERAILGMKVGQVIYLKLGEYTRDIGLALENIKAFSRKAQDFDLHVVETETGKLLRINRKKG